MRPSQKASMWRSAVERLESRDLLALFLFAGNITASQQTPFSGEVAFLGDTNLSAKPSDFNNPPGSVEINWGDGTSSPGTVVGVGVPGSFQVDGTHTYAVAGSFIATIDVKDQSGNTSSKSVTATVSSQTTTPTSTLTIGANAITGVAGLPLASTTTVATFIDPDNTDATADFNALITWGDGQVSAGTINGANGVFTVTGSNTYATANTYTTTVSVVGVGAAPSATAMGVATITSPTATNYLFSGILAPVGNGPYVSSGYTNTNQPTFSGTALPFSTVQLYARPFGIDTQMPLGETVANASGEWTLTAGPLAALTYSVTATITPSGGYPSSLMLLTTNDGAIHVDMAPKKMKKPIHRTPPKHHLARRSTPTREALRALELHAHGA